MKAFEYTKQGNLNNLEPVQRKFTAKMIVKEVEKIAKENNISEETAYWGYTHGLFGADREMDGIN